MDVSFHISFQYSLHNYRHETRRVSSGRRAVTMCVSQTTPGYSVRQRAVAREVRPVPPRPVRDRVSYRLANRNQVKGYHDIAGDGGSRVLEQVAEQRARITDGLAGVRHLLAVGSGKGGVGRAP